MKIFLILFKHSLRCVITAVNYSLLRWIDNLFPIIFYVSFVVMLKSVISKQFANDSYTSFVSLHAWG